jgi:hypothetical protein
VNDFIGVFCLLSVFNVAFSAETQEVFIEGVISERREVNRPGQSVVISPSGETRFDTQTHFKADPSLQMSGTGRTTGFSLPLFRGQDARSSHVFVDDMELQDPYSGLPMIDDVDLRAFGTMLIHKGVSPWNVPVLDPGGVIQFTLRGQDRPLKMGTAHGDVSGSMAWLRGRLKIGDDFSLGLYGRGVRSNGEHSYFSDNNTILNPNDDKVRRRANNDYEGVQALIHSAWTSETMTVKGLGWSQQSQRGIPLGEVTGDGRARARSSTQVLTASLRNDVTEDVWLGLDMGGIFAQRRFYDPDQSIGFATRRHLISRSVRGRIKSGYESQRLSLIGTFERQDANTSLSSSYSSDRFSPRVSIYKLFAGSKFSFFKDHTLELKFSTQWSTNEASDAAGAQRTESQSRPSHSGSVAWSRFVDSVLIYAQAAKYTRAPSLLERLGDGGQIEGSSDLASEVASAFEVGGRLVFDLGDDVRGLLSLALWSRDNAEVIRIDRVSPLRWRALNLGQQKYRGVEARVDFGSALVGLEGALSWMRANQAETQKLVPVIPMWQGSLGVRWQPTPQVSVRSVSQYVGRMYHDTSNSREIMWTLTHDASVDWVSLDNRWSVGLSLMNLTDVTSIPIRDVVTGQADGRIARRYYQGQQLPGRSWLVSATAGI